MLILFPGYLIPPPCVSVVVHCPSPHLLSEELVHFKRIEFNAVSVLFVASLHLRMISIELEAWPLIEYRYLVTGAGLV
jgi:hypothetical protein